MPEQTLPPWGDDPLSSFFRDAEYNERVTSLNLPTLYTLLQRVHALFKRVAEAVEHDSREELLIPRFIMPRTLSSFLAAIRLIMSGQISESYPVLRVALEQAWYALYIAKDPQPPARTEIWLRRNEDEASKLKCKNEFTVANVRSTHASLDTVTSRQLHQLYETLIDFGGHPNQRGVLTAMSMSETEQETNWQVGLLAPKKVPLVAALKTTVEVAIGTFKVFQLIFPERFAIMGLDEEINSLVRELSRVIAPYAQKARDDARSAVSS